MLFKNLILSFVFYVSPIIVMAQSFQSSEQQEVYNTIVLIGKAWTQNNLDTLEKYLDKDYEHTDVRGQILDRASWLSYVKDRKEKNVTNPDIEFKDVKITIYSDLAFVTGINIFSGQAYTANDTNTKLRQLRFTQILKKEDNVWKRLMFQATYIDMQ